MKSNTLFFVLAAFTIITVLFFYPVFLKGYIPFPGDLLLAEYQPWRSTSYNGIAAGGIPNKAQYFDTLRQLYPWKTFVIQSIKKSVFPLWNPYNFSGSPLFANFQSALLFPLNVFYFIFPQATAWTMLIILQPVLCLFSVYALGRLYGLSRMASVFSATAYAFCLYMTAFLEYNIMGHFMYLVPLAMLAIEWVMVQKKWAPLTLIGTVAVSGFAGHAQLFAGLIFYVLLYSVIRTLQTKKNWTTSLQLWLSIVFFIVIGVGVAGIQLLPGLELIGQSARSSHSSAYFYNNLLIKPSQLILYFIPDLFGNPAAKNYIVPFSYPSKAIYVGLATLYLAVMSFSAGWKNTYWKTITICTILVGSVVFLTPISLILYKVNIPFLSTSSPSNFIFLISLGICILAGFGFDQFFKSQSRKRYYVTLAFFWVVIGATFVITRITATPVVFRNIIYSVLVLLSLTVLITVIKTNKKIPTFAAKTLFILIVCVDLFYFFHKFNPFVPKLFIYPKTPVGEWLVKNSGIDRFWGYSYGGIQANFPTQIGIYSPDGYDPLYPKKYGQFIQASVNGKIPEVFSDQTRSDAMITGGFGKTNMTDNTHRLRLLSLLGVKYILDKAENASTLETFPVSLFTKIATVDDFNIFAYKKAAPRFFLTNSYSLYNTSKDFADKFFAPTFDSAHTLLLNEKPDIDASITPGKQQATLVSYKPNSVIIDTKSDTKTLLFLSDTYYPGWKAFIDNDPQKIYVANYTFRAVAVPSGSHRVTFRYEPDSLRYGFYVTIASITATVIFLLLTFLYNKKVLQSKYTKK